MRWVWITRYFDPWPSGRDRAVSIVERGAWTACLYVILSYLVHMSMRQWTGSCHLQAQRLVFDGWQTVLCSARWICSDHCLGSLLQIIREREEQGSMNEKSAEIKWNKCLYINMHLISYIIYKPTQTVINLWTGKDGWTRGAHSLFLSLSIAGSISLSTGCWLRVETHWVAQAAANASVAFPWQPCVLAA